VHVVSGQTGSARASTCPSAGFGVETHSRVFRGTPDQVSQARRFLAALLAGLPTAEEAALCLSELVTNSVQHSRSGWPGGLLTVRVVLIQAVVYVAVDDQGGPWAPRAEPDELGGRGLAIVRELADGSGISGGDSGRTAWFRISVRPAAADLADGPG
jgi:serine/threonine-protein kinase RsbW